jgi:phosphoglycolate phosphatase
MSRAFEVSFGIADSFRDIPMAGRTDASILSDALAARGLLPTSASVDRFRETYLQYLAEELTKPGPRKGIMPGVRDLLDELTDDDAACLALLTGNYEAGARAKLEYFDLWRYFRCGAFGDDAPDRNGLFRKALAAVEACEGRSFTPAETVIVGDTPLDVACARAGGARSIGVATGNHDAAALRAAGADVVLEDLSKTADVLALIRG